MRFREANAARIAYCIGLLLLVSLARPSCELILSNPAPERTIMRRQRELEGFEASERENSSGCSSDEMVTVHG